MIDKKGLSVIAFDYGNTLIEFTKPQLLAMSEALQSVLEELYGPFDIDVLNEIRRKQILAPYERDFVENEMYEVSAELVRVLFDQEPTAEVVHRIMQTRQDAFVDAVFLPEGVRELLESIGERYRLGFISNYPCGDSIRNTLAKFGIEALFESTVISGEVTRIKPHALIYETLLENMGVGAEEVVYIGDNWLADVQGAKRMGMQSIWTKQYLPYENFQPQDGDHEPDAVIEHLDELGALLL